MKLPKEEIQIILPYPTVTGNHLWRFTPNGVVVNEIGRKYYQAVEASVRAQGARYGISVPMTVIMRVYLPDARKRDLTNIAKVVEDALTKAGFWEDDSLVHRSIHEKRGIDPERPRIEVGVAEFRLEL